MPEEMEVTYLGDMLENIVFGPHFFEIAVILIDSLLSNGTMSNAEIWYNLRRTEVDEFESPDRLLLKARRLNNLHCLLKQNKTAMLNIVEILYQSVEQPIQRRLD